MEHIASSLRAEGMQNCTTAKIGPNRSTVSSVGQKLNYPKVDTIHQILYAPKITHVIASLFRPKSEHFIAGWRNPIGQSRFSAHQCNHAFINEIYLRSRVICGITGKSRSSPSIVNDP
jgi:hypothetical protein